MGRYDKLTKMKTSKDDKSTCQLYLRPAVDPSFFSLISLSSNFDLCDELQFSLPLCTVRVPWARTVFTILTRIPPSGFCKE